MLDLLPLLAALLLLGVAALLVSKTARKYGAVLGAYVGLALWYAFRRASKGERAHDRLRPKPFIDPKRKANLEKAKAARAAPGGQDEGPKAS